MILILPIFAQDVSQERMVRFSLWASMEAYPGVESLNKDSFATPIKKIRDISPFILSGMVYGWKFVYVPYDKARGVSEYFEFSPVTEFSESEINSIQYAKPWIEDSILNCWVEYRRSDEQIHIFKGWQSILQAKIKGEGYANYAKGFDGIKEACSEALKNAVRSYERKWIKSKPKEISGTVFMYEPPKIGLKSGRYKVTLDFFMETDRILEYKTF
ncbi:hypothetical protein [uncultured Treponema sp.]|uniref:hypothetical protein n=1 Tax=uncultured Treponema sp. TaxID=162155 RepID=UPI0025E46056|nr:hypothetical protein [uncultured Treponema sp.]